MALGTQSQDPGSIAYSFHKKIDSNLVITDNNFPRDNDGHMDFREFIIATNLSVR